MKGRIALALFVVIVFIRPAFAEQALSLEWTVVPGARSYRIVIQTKQDERIVLDETIPENRLTFRLAAGAYRYRLAAIDRLDQPSPWSPWYDLFIRGTGQPTLAPDSRFRIAQDAGPQLLRVRGQHLYDYTKVHLRDPDGQTVELVNRGLSSEGELILAWTARSGIGNYTLTLENPRGYTRTYPEFLVVYQRLPERESFPAWWKYLIPGLVQFERGDTIRGYLWPGLLIATAGAGAAEYYRADQLAASRAADPALLLFNDVLVFSLFQSELSGEGATLAGIQIREDARADQSSYDRAQENQAIAGGLAMLLYVAHLVDAIWFVPTSPSDGQTTTVDTEVWLSTDRHDLRYDASVTWRF